MADIDHVRVRLAAIKKKIPEAKGPGTKHERNLPGARGDKARREYAEYKKNTLDKIPDFDPNSITKKDLERATKENEAAKKRARSF